MAPPIRRRNRGPGRGTDPYVKNAPASSRSYAVSLATLLAFFFYASFPHILSAATVPIKDYAGGFLNMPVVGQGSCCGAYNISSWLSQGGIHIE